MGKAKDRITQIKWAAYFPSIIKCFTWIGMMGSDPPCLEGSKYVRWNDSRKVSRLGSDDYDGKRKYFIILKIVNFFKHFGKTNSVVKYYWAIDRDIKEFESWLSTFTSIKNYCLFLTSTRWYSLGRILFLLCSMKCWLKGAMKLILSDRENVITSFSVSIVTIYRFWISNYLIEKDNLYSYSLTLSDP